MGVWVVEEVAFDAPGFVVDLLPLGTGIDDGFQAAQVEGLAGAIVAGLQVVGGGDGPSALAGIEHLGAVKGDLEVVQIAQDHLRLAFFQSETPDGVNARTVALAAGAAEGPTLAEI